MRRRRLRRPVPGHPRWVGYSEMVRSPCDGYSSRYERRVRIGRARLWLWRTYTSLPRTAKASGDTPPGFAGRRGRRVTAGLYRWALCRYRAGLDVCVDGEGRETVLEPWGNVRPRSIP